MRKQLRCPFDGRRLLDYNDEFTFEFIPGSTEGYRKTIEVACPKCRQERPGRHILKFGEKIND
jgi:hypothetical protein